MPREQFRCETGRFAVLAIDDFSLGRFGWGVCFIVRVIVEYERRCGFYLGIPECIRVEGADLALTSIRLFRLGAVTDNQFCTDLDFDSGEYCFGIQEFVKHRDRHAADFSF